MEVEDGHASSAAFRPDAGAVRAFLRSSSPPHCTATAAVANPVVDLSSGTGADGGNSAGGRHRASRSPPRAVHGPRRPHLGAHVGVRGGRRPGHHARCHHLRTGGSRRRALRLLWRAPLGVDRAYLAHPRSGEATPRSRRIVHRNLDVNTHRPVGGLREAVGLSSIGAAGRSCRRSNRTPPFRAAPNRGETTAR